LVLAPQPPICKLLLTTALAVLGVPASRVSDWATPSM
jgi:hypothetical protein